MLDISKLQVGCTYLGTIMSESKAGITQFQLSEIETLISKVKPLTEKQKSRLLYLEAKRDAIESLPLSKSAQKMLISWYLEIKYGKRYKPLTDANVDYLVKGTLTEPNAFNLLNKRFDGGYYRLKTRFRDKYLTGIIDGADAEFLEEATKIIEVKTADTLNSFTSAIMNDVSTQIYWQAQGYIAMTGKDVVEIANVLTEYPEQVIQEQHRLLYNKYCPNDEVTERFMKIWDIAYKQMMYMDVPIEERIKVRQIERNDSQIELIHEKVEMCWEFLQKMDEHHSKLFL